MPALFCMKCGHIKDKDNNSVIFKTTESEISAWSHAISDFNSLVTNADEKTIFCKVMISALRSYKIADSLINEMNSGVIK